MVQPKQKSCILLHKLSFFLFHFHHSHFFCKIKQICGHREENVKFFLANQCKLKDWFKTQSFRISKFIFQVFFFFLFSISLLLSIFFFVHFIWVLSLYFTYLNTSKSNISPYVSSTFLLFSYNKLNFCHLQPIRWLLNAQLQ